MAEGAAPVAPRLMLPPEEAAALRAAYGRAEVILEYGAGGSTAMAAAMPGRTVIAVESDAEFLARLAEWFAAAPPAARVILHHADIGPVGRWGRPVGQAARDRWPGYALSVWDRPGLPAPDTVLVDGRFRVACFLAVLFRSSRPVTLWFDDYTGRPAYHVVERYARPAATVGRMARFDLVPMPVPAADLGFVIQQFGRPQ